MSQYRRNARKTSAWLAFVAVLIQALVPNIVGAEIALAASEGLEVGLLNCPFGHLHPSVVPHAAAHHHGGASDEDTPPANHTPDSGGLADACSICIALHSGGQFTAPAEFQVFAPQAQPRALAMVARRDRFTSLVVSTAYDARAPPQIL